jgi:signal peptidase
MYLILPDIFSGFIGIYVIRPLLLILLAVMVFIIARFEEVGIWRLTKYRRWSVGNNPFQAGILIGGFQITLLLFMGFLKGFAKSPYQSTLQGFILNLLFVISSLFAIELSRSYLIKKGAKNNKNVGSVIILVTLFFFSVQIIPKLLNMSSLDSPVEAVQFIGADVLPLISMGLFASYLVYYGGAVAGIGYMGVLQFFEWFSPVLPNLEWMPIAFISTIGPALGFLLIQSSIKLPRKHLHQKSHRRRMKDPSVRWMGVAIICIVLIFFSYGFLGVKPTVIYSGSMNPMLDVGDIVIIGDADVGSLKEGDIIQFRSGNKLIVHRVYEITSVGDERLFITKGDANTNPDPDIIYPSQIQGKAISTIPKLGWISIYLRNIF